MSYRREPRVSQETWILVADRAKAIVYRSTWPEMEQIEEVQSLENADGATHPSKIWTDQRGHFGGPVHDKQTGDPQTDYRHQSAQSFGVELVEMLEKGRKNNHFGRLIVIAPPLLLGVLRDRVSSPLGKTVVLDISKELVDSRPEEILEQIQESLAVKAGNGT